MLDACLVFHCYRHHMLDACLVWCTVSLMCSYGIREFECVLLCLREHKGKIRSMDCGCQTTQDIHPDDIRMAIVARHGRDVCLYQEWKVRQLDREGVWKRVLLSQQDCHGFSAQETAGKCSIAEKYYINSRVVGAIRAAAAAATMFTKRRLLYPKINPHSGEC